MARVVVFHTTDFHNRLTVPQARKLAALKKEADFSMLLDSGDAIGAGNLTYRPGGEPILELMASAGYDAMAMGNRESHPNYAVLKKKLAQATFPVLAANLRPQRGKPMPDCVRSHIIALLGNGLRVAVVGLAPQITAPESWWRRVTDYVFDEPQKTAEGLVKKLRPQADVVILLTHLGIAADRMLAGIEGVHLVLGGHGHRPIMPPEKVGAAYIAHAPPYARGASRLAIEVHDAGVEVSGDVLEL
jgi:2',3'-cyclic-nucleotide 2'-phosphodiesterase (5'-nucleotidase family)